MATEKKTKNTSSAPSSLHPPYFQMISEAINTMKDRTGSSQPAIAKFIEENYTKHLPPNFKKILSVQLKRFVKSEKLVKVKNSYKTSTVEKLKKPSKTLLEKSNPTQKKKPAKKKSAEIPVPKFSVAKETVDKATKTKRLSQVKTPPVLKKTTKMVVKKDTGSAAGVKNRAATPAKRKAAKTGSKPPTKKPKN